MPIAKPIRIVLAEQHPIYRLGVRTLLERDHALEIVGEAINGEQTLSLVASLRPEILLLDQSFPDISGVELLSRLATLRSPTRAIMLTASMDQADLQSALLNGAWGVIFKNTATDILPKCIRQVARGEHWVGVESVNALVGGLHLSRSERRSGLTPREVDVVRRIAKGVSNKDIASQLGLSEQTIKNYLRRIFEKLNVTNRVELALRAYEQQLISDKAKIQDGQKPDINK